MGRVGVVGSVNTDLVTMIDRMPQAGETRAATGFAVGRGGKGANQAVAAARAGAETLFVGAVGDDAFGRDALAAFADDQIDTRHIIRVPDRPTGTATIIVEASGQNRILIEAGANARLCPSDIDQAASTLATCDLILLQLEIPLETVLHTIDVAARIGVPVLLNPAPAVADLPIERLGVRFLAPNETELALLTGGSIETEPDAVEAGVRLLGRGITSVIVTRGQEGALLVEADGTYAIPAQAARAVDTTGAGDAFLGSFAARWTIDRDTLAALRFATRYAAISVTKPGAQASYPRSDMT